jgi:hypothetical protein
VAPPRKTYLLRIPQELYDAYEGWAADEFRSVNAQIAAVLSDAARRAGRLRGTRPRQRGAAEPTHPGAEVSRAADPDRSQRDE